MNDTDYVRDIEKIKELVVISLFTDDDLMDMFVLKGGNALSIAHKINDRSSRDIDVSMESDFEEELPIIEEKLKLAFDLNFEENGLVVFDFKLKPSPVRIREDLKQFWGGYNLTFKVIEKEKYSVLKNDEQKLRLNAIVFGSNQEKSFEVDISKYEYCETKQPFPLKGYTIYVYTPLMVVYEKLRAICQQMEEYREIVPTNRRPRPRDFFDIYTIMDSGLVLNETSPDNLKILKEIFEIKKVPLSFLEKIADEREFHRDAFKSVQTSVGADYKIGTYDFYFDYILTLSQKILSSLQEHLGQEEVAAGNIE